MASKERRSKRISGRITPGLNKLAEAELKKRDKWTMSDLIEEGLIKLLKR